MKSLARLPFTKMNWKEQAERIIAQEREILAKESEKKRIAQQIAQQRTAELARRTEEQDKAILARLGVSKKLADISSQVWRAGRVEYGVKYVKHEGNTASKIGYTLQAKYPVKVETYYDNVHREDSEFPGGGGLVKSINTGLTYTHTDDWVTAELGVYIQRKWASTEYIPHSEYPTSRDYDLEKSNFTYCFLTPDTKVEDLDRFLLADCVRRISMKGVPGEYLRRYGGAYRSRKECEEAYYGRRLY